MRAQPRLCFGRHWHVPMHSAMKTLAHIEKKKKTLITDIDRKKCWLTSARKDDRSMFKKEESPDDADRTFNNRHHPNIIQGLNRITITDIGRCKVATDIFLPTLRNIFLQTLADNISLR